MRKKQIPSIITESHSCFIHEHFLGVEVNGVDYHHFIHGNANRKLADIDGLGAFLCKNCHTNLHDKGLYDKELQKIAEQTWLDYYGKSVEDWIKRYGKNFLD